MSLRVLTLVALCCACGNGSAAKEDGTLQQAIDEANAAHERLCTVVDRCYPSLQTADSCVLPSTFGTQGIERAGAKDSACVRAVLGAHPKEAAAAFDCLAEAENAAATCAQDCPEGKLLDDCISSRAPETEGGCLEAWEKVITREEAAALEACEADGADGG